MKERMGKEERRKNKKNVNFYLCKSTAKTNCFVAPTA